MADSTIDSDLIILDNHWPGQANLQHTAVDITDAVSHHNLSATPGFRYGAKALYYNVGTAGQPGYATLTYLEFGAVGSTSAAKDVCMNDSGTEWFSVTNDPDNPVVTPTGMCAVGLSLMTATYWGWFWTDGICPEDLVSGLAGNYRTTGALVAGTIAAGDTVDEDYNGFDVQAATTGSCGFSLAADP